MKYRSYHSEFKNFTAQMLDLFNNIVISRFQQDSVEQQNFTVPCLYASRSRILKSLENRNKTLELPLLHLTMSGISRDSTRAMSLHDGILTQRDGQSYNFLKNTPVPINIQYTLGIITKFHEDMDQILTNFVPFFNPSVYVVIPHPIQSGKKLKCQVVWNGEVAVEFPDEIDKNTPSRITATTSFTLKAWIFPGRSLDVDDGHYIKRINFNPCIQYESGIGRLGAWYAVPEYDKSTDSNVTFDSYLNDIICGYIKFPYFDFLQISAGVSGYWHDISGTCSGLQIDQHITDDPCYMVTDEGGLLVVSERCYISQGMAAIGLDGYVDYYLSTVSGDLSGYTGTDCLV